MFQLMISHRSNEIFVSIWSKTAPQYLYNANGTRAANKMWKKDHFAEVWQEYEFIRPIYTGIIQSSTRYEDTLMLLLLV